MSVVIPSSSSPSVRRPSVRRAARLARLRATDGAVVLRPKEVCAQLAVSAATLRAWSTVFQDYLSPAAQVAPAPGHAHRRYTAADVQLLTDIGKLRHLGYSCDEVKRRLPPPARGDEPDLSAQLAERDQRLRELEEALARALAHVGSLEEQTVRSAERLEAEQAAHDETRRALHEAQQQLAEAQRANARLIEANLGLHAQVAHMARELNAPVWRRVFQSRA